MANELTTVGYIGLGLMGQPMVMRRLEAGFQVTAWGRTQVKLQEADTTSVITLLRDKPVL